MVNKWFGLLYEEGLYDRFLFFFSVAFFLLFEVCIILFYYMSPFGLHEDHIPRIFSFQRMRAGPTNSVSQLV